MYIDGMTVTALVVFFVVAAAVIYRWLMSVCGKLCEYRQAHEPETPPEGRS